MVAADPVAPEPRRFSIRAPRALWFGLVAVALLVASLGLHIGLPIYRQHATIREIERLGGKVTTRNVGSDPVHRWIDSQGITDFHEVYTVDLKDTQTSDADLDKLNGLTKLTYLGLENTHITDVGLHKLMGLGLTDVTWLVCDDTQVTDTGIKHLEAYAHLELLSLNNTMVTDEGLKYLSGLKLLYRIDLNGTQVTDQGLTHLARLPLLMQLDLSGMQITDEGLATLKTVTELRTLSLTGTQVTDAGLIHLKGLTRLHTLSLSKTQVTENGVAELKRALPKLEITK